MQDAARLTTPSPAFPGGWPSEINTQAANVSTPTANNNTLIRQQQLSPASDSYSSDSTPRRLRHTGVIRHLRSGSADSPIVVEKNRRSVLSIPAASDSEGSSTSDVYASASEMYSTTSSRITSPLSPITNMHNGAANSDDPFEAVTPRPYATFSGYTSTSRARPSILPRDNNRLSNSSKRSSIQEMEESLANMRQLLDIDGAELSNSSMESSADERPMPWKRSTLGAHLFDDDDSHTLLPRRSHSSLEGRYRHGNADSESTITLSRPQSSLYQADSNSRARRSPLSHLASRRRDDHADSQTAYRRPQDGILDYYTSATPNNRTTPRSTRSPLPTTNNFRSTFTTRSPGQRRLSNLEGTSEVSYGSSTASARSVRSPGVPPSSASPVYSDEMVRVEPPQQYTPDDVVELQTLLQTERSKYAASQQAYSTTLSALTTLTQTYFSEKSDLRRENEHLSEALGRESRNSGKLRTVMTELEEMSTNMQELMNLNREYEHGYQETVSKLEERESQMEHMREENEALRADIADLEQELAKMRADMTTLELTLKSEHSTLSEKAKEDLQRVQKDLDDAIKAKESTLSAHERAFTDIQQQHNDALNAKDEEIALLKHQVETTQQRHKEIEDAHGKLLNEHTSLRDVHGASLTEYNNLVSSLQKDHDSLREEHITTSSQLTTAQLELDSLRSRIAEMQKTQDAERADAEAKEVELETLKRVLRGRMHNIDSPMRRSPSAPTSPTSAGSPKKIGLTSPTHRAALPTGNGSVRRFGTPDPPMAVKTAFVKRVPSLAGFIDSGSELELPSDLERELEGLGAASGNE